MEIHVHSTLAKEYNGRRVIPTQTNKGTHICTSHVQYQSKKRTILNFMLQVFYTTALDPVIILKEYSTVCNCTFIVT